MPFVESPQLQFINIVVDIPFVPHTQILLFQTIQQTTEFHQLFVFGGRCPCCAVVQVLRCCLFEASRDPTVQLVVLTVVVQRQFLWSRLFVLPLTLHSCSTRL